MNTPFYSLPFIVDDQSQSSSKNQLSPTQIIDDINDEDFKNLKQIYYTPSEK